MTDARQEFDRIFGDVVMSDNDAAWYIFKAGWNAARASGPYQSAERREAIERSLWVKRKIAGRERCED